MLEINPIDIVREEIGFAVDERRDVNIERIISKMGIALNKKANLHDDISGQISKRPNGLYEISINKNDGYFRRRFTMAHECGHYVFHKALIGNGVDDNKAYRSAPYGEFRNEQITQKHETEANQFAANVLMPGELIDAIKSDLGINDSISPSELEELSRRLKVSQPALKIRLKI